MDKCTIVTRNMQAGGAERVIAQLANYMSDNQIQCSIITLDKKEIFYNISGRVDIYQIGVKSQNHYIDKLLKYKEVRNHIRRLNPDVVLAMPEEVGIYAILALFRTNIPVVVSERNNPWVMPWKKGTRLLRKLSYPFASGLIFQTQQAASFFPDHIRNKGVILPNPLDVECIPPLWKGKRRKEVVGVGRLEKQKNFPLLIKAFARFHEQHRDYILTIYGEGTLEDELKSLAASILPKGTYFFPGKTIDILERIQGAEMFVLSSDYEGMPNVLIEAMAMGIPVISTDCPSGGPAELIEDGKNGILIPVGNMNALHEAMCRIAEEKAFGDNIGRNAQMIKEQLDSTVVAKQWKEYLDVTSKQSHYPSNV